jgi:phosphopantetheinyl transferase (holo-ACP synthase)
MTILGIGVDVLYLPRLTRHLADNRLARRILSPTELREYLALPEENHGRRIRFLGVRCAIPPPLTRVRWFDQYADGQ